MTRVLILHSDIAEHAPPDEQDTLVTAAAVADALRQRGHETGTLRFVPEPSALVRAIEEFRADVVFNLVESVYADGWLSALAPAILEKRGIAYTGAGASCVALTADKPLSKHLLRAAGLPTADWAEPPTWDGLLPERRYVVKSATEDASLGLDDDAVAQGALVRERADALRVQYGGRWFAEAYLEGREFNLALLEEEQNVRVLPIAEMCFDAWQKDRPRIVGYAAKWDDASEDAKRTVRAFGVENAEPELARQMAELAQRTWRLFRLRGYGRIDFRLDAAGSPMILEANPNPCLEPNAGFAAAGQEAGLGYGDVVDRILRAGCSA